MKRIEEFCCLNLGCVDYGKRGARNLRQHGWSSKKKGEGGIRTLYCKTCGEYFSERKGTALWQSHLPEKKAIAVLEHLVEGCGIRKISRLVKVKKDTVSRLCRKSGEHAKALHDELVAFSPSDKRGAI